MAYVKVRVCKFCASVCSSEELSQEKFEEELAKDNADYSQVNGVEYLTTYTYCGCQD